MHSLVTFMGSRLQGVVDCQKISPKSIFKNHVTLCNYFWTSENGGLSKNSCKQLTQYFVKTETFVLNHILIGWLETLQLGREAQHLLWCSIIRNTKYCVFSVQRTTFPFSFYYGQRKSIQVCGKKTMELWNYIVFFILILTVFDSFIHIFITLYLLHFNHLKEMLIVKN